MDKDGYHGYDKPVIDESAAKRIATALGWAPKREWVGLTDAEMKRTCYEACSYDPYTIARAIEAALRSKNT